MSSIGSVLESRFKLKENKTNIQTEVLAGVTTFATMSYVLATIPNMLEQAGLVRGAILTALICAVVICSVAMALYTNRPFCLAPGMSSVAILSSVGSMNMTMEVAYGLIFIEGVIFCNYFLCRAPADYCYRHSCQYKNFTQRRYWPLYRADWFEIWRHYYGQ